VGQSDRDGTRSLLFVAVSFPPWGGGGTLRATKLVKYLARLGWDLTVVCSDEAALDTVDTALLQDIPSSVRVLRVRGPFRAAGRVGKSAADGASRRSWLRPLARFGKAAARSVLIPDRWLGWARRVGGLDLEALGRVEAVVSSGPPHSAHLAGDRLAARLGVPHVVDLRDDWADNPVNDNQAPWHRRVQALVERRIVSRAARIVVVSDAAREVFARRHPALAERVVVIPNGYDPEDLPEAPRRQRASGSPIVFLHAGTLRHRRVSAPFFTAFGAVARRAPHLHLELLGQISADHEREARDLIQASNLSIRSFVPHAAALDAMAAADVLVVITSQAEAGPATYTGKIFEYLALGRPILLIAPEGPAASLVRESNAGLVADPTDVDGIEAAITEVATLAMDPSFRGAPQEILLRFDRSALAGDWDRMLTTLARPPAFAAPVQDLANRTGAQAMGRSEVCARCVMDTSDPDITFDSTGICNHCRYAETVLPSVRWMEEDSRRALASAAERVRRAGEGHEYDAVIGLSGGVDSSYAALLAHRHGIRTLAVHFDNGWNSEVAVGNIERIVDKCGFDLITHVINWAEFRDLQRAFLLASVIDIELVTDNAIVASMINLARQHKIKYVLSGYNLATEHGLPAAWVWHKLDWTNIKAIHEAYGEVPLRTYPHISTTQWRLLQLLRRAPHTVQMLNLMNYRRDVASQTLTGEFGWKSYGDKHQESLFTKFYQGAILPQKFGVDKRRVHLSDRIRNGEVGREEALAVLATPVYTPEELRVEGDFVRKKLGFTEEQWQSIMMSPPRSHAEFKSDRSRTWVIGLYRAARRVVRAGRRDVPGAL